MIEFREPPRTGFEIGWRILGTRYRILSSFFLYGGLFAAFIVWQVVGNNPLLLAIGIALDLACILAIVLFIATVEAIVYRSYGIRSAVVVQEFGSAAYPEHEPPFAIQRIVADLSYPAACFLCYALVVYSNEALGWRGTSVIANVAYLILEFVSLFWGITGLLPVYPHPMGKVVYEVLAKGVGRYALLITLMISILVGGAYIAYTVAVYSGNMKRIPLPDDKWIPAQPIVAIFFGLTLMHNWSMLPLARQIARANRPDPDDLDDRVSWER